MISNISAAMAWLDRPEPLQFAITLCAWLFLLVMAMALDLRLASRDQSKNRKDQR